MSNQTINTIGINSLGKSKYIIIYLAESSKFTELREQH